MSDSKSSLAWENIKYWYHKKFHAHIGWFTIWEFDPVASVWWTIEQRCECGRYKRVYPNPFARDSAA